MALSRLAEPFQIWLVSPYAQAKVQASDYLGEFKISAGFRVSGGVAFPNNAPISLHL